MFNPRSSSRGDASVGNILLLAIGVLLAASVGAFALGLMPGLGGQVTAAVEVDQNPSTIDVRVTDMGNADRIEIRDPARTINLTSVGETANLDRTGCHVTVVGVHDGQETVLTSFDADVASGSGGGEGLAAVWSFEDCQIDGSGLIDSTGSQQGAIEGDPQVVEGVAGKAFHFDGDDRIVIGTRGGFEDMTVSVWVKPTEDNGWIGGNGAKWRIRDIPSSDQFQFWIREEGFGSSYSVHASAGEDITGNWYHVVGVYDTTEDENDQMRIYVNGNLMESTTTGANLDPDGHSNMVIADSYQDGSDPSGEYDTATIDEFRLYTTDFTDQQVQELCERDAPAGHPCAP